MADAELQNQWDQTSFMVAAILTASFGNKRKHDPRRLNPYPGLRHRRRQQTPEQIFKVLDSVLMPLIRKAEKEAR